MISKELHLRVRKNCMPESASGKFAIRFKFELHYSSDSVLLASAANCAQSSRFAKYCQSIECNIFVTN